MQKRLETAHERTILDLGWIDGRPMTWEDITPDGGPCVPTPPIGTVLEAQILPPPEDDTDEPEESRRLPRRVICRPTGEWASLEV